MEGYKGHVKSKYQRQKCYFIETAWHKGQPDRQKARAGVAGNDASRNQVGDQDQCGVSKGILQIAKQLAKWHLCQFCPYCSEYRQHNQARQLESAVSADEQKENSGLGWRFAAHF